MAAEKDNVLEILDDVERKVEEFRAAAIRLVEDKKELERSVAFVESLSRDMPEMSEVSLHYAYKGGRVSSQKLSEAKFHILPV